MIDVRASKRKIRWKEMYEEKLLNFYYMIEEKYSLCMFKM